MSFISVLLALLAALEVYSEICISPYTYSATDLCSTTCYGNNCNIYDDSSITSNIYVTDNEIPFPASTITSLGIYIIAEHGFTSDLGAYLTHDGNTITLFDKVGGTTPTGIDIILKEDSMYDRLVNSDSLNCTGECTKQPKYADNSLDTFYGSTPLGDWSLVISDSVTQDEGIFLGWCISQLCYDTNLAETCVTRTQENNDLMCNTKCRHGANVPIFNETDCYLVPEVPMYSSIPITSELLGTNESVVLTNMQISLDGDNFTTASDLLFNISMAGTDSIALWTDVYTDDPNINLSIADGFMRINSDSSLDCSECIYSPQNKDLAFFTAHDLVNSYLELQVFSNYQGNKNGYLHQFCADEICFTKSNYPTPAPTTEPPTPYTPVKCVGYEDNTNIMCSSTCTRNCSIVDQKTTESNIYIPESFLDLPDAYIKSLTLKIDANHSYTGDLEFVLYHGKYTLPLFEGVGRNGDNVHILLDDAATPLVRDDKLSCKNYSSCTYGLMSPFKLSELNGRLVSAHNFTLSISDLAYADEGELLNWCVASLCYADGSDMEFTTAQPTSAPEVEECIKVSDSDDYENIMCTTECDDSKDCVINPDEKLNSILTSTIGSSKIISKYFPDGATITDMKIDIYSDYTVAADLQFNLSHTDDNGNTKMITLFGNLEGDGISVTMVDKATPITENDRVDNNGKFGPMRPNKLGYFEGQTLEGKNGFQLRISNLYGNDGSGKLTKWCLDKICYKYTPTEKKHKSKNKISDAEIAVMILIPVIIVLIIIIIYQCYTQKRQSAEVVSFNQMDDKEYKPFIDVNSDISGNGNLQNNEFNTLPDENTIGDKQLL